MEYEIVENTASNFHYHLRKKGEKETLCGKTDVMSTLYPIDNWGHKSDWHIPESYCRSCDNIFFNKTHKGGRK